MAHSLRLNTGAQIPGLGLVTSTLTRLSIKDAMASPLRDKINSNNASQKTAYVNPPPPLFTLSWYTPRTSLQMETLKKILKKLCFCIETEDEPLTLSSKGNGRGISGGSKRDASFRGRPPIRLYDAPSIKSNCPISLYEPFHHESVRSSILSKNSVSPQGSSFFAARTPSELETRLKGLYSDHRSCRSKSHASDSVRSWESALYKDQGCTKSSRSSTVRSAHINLYNPKNGIF
jgi:hypothetical protein